MAGRPSGALGNRWIALAVLTLARTAMGAQFQSVAAISPLLMERLHIGNTEIGVLVGLFSLPGVVLALPGGLLGARFGDRRVVLAGLALMAVGSAVIGVAGTYATAVTGRVFSAIGAVLVNVVLTKMVADWFTGREIVWAMSVFINAWPLGIGIALFTVPAMADAWGLAAAFDVAALVAVIGFAALLLLYRDPPVVAARPGTIGLKTLARREVALVGLAALPWTLYNAAYVVVLAFLPALLVRAGMSVEQAGAVLGTTTLIVIVSVQGGGALGQWVVRPALLVVAGLVVFAAGIALLPYAAAVPTLVVAGVFGGLPASVLVAAPASVLRPESRAPGMGLFYTSYYAGMSVLPPLAGRLQDAYAGAAALDFAVVALLATLASYVIFLAVGARVRA
jgi:MFS family permease